VEVWSRCVTLKTSLGEVGMRKEVTSFGGERVSAPCLIAPKLTVKSPLLSLPEP
jgi:hypothetical protein